MDVPGLHLSKERLIAFIKTTIPGIIQVKIEFVPKSTIRVIVFAKDIRGVHKRSHTTLSAVLKNTSIQIQVIRI